MINYEDLSLISFDFSISKMCFYLKIIQRTRLKVREMSRGCSLHVRDYTHVALIMEQIQTRDPDILMTHIVRIKPSDRPEDITSSMKAQHSK